MSAASDNLRTLYPAFEDAAAFTDAALDAFIAFAQDELDQSVWGDLYQRGTLALAAHLIEVGKRSANSGGVGFSGAGSLGSINTGDESVSFSAVPSATAKGDEVSLMTTDYGLEFLRLQRQVVRPYFVVI